MGTYSDIRDQRYQSELDIGTSDIGLKRAESDITGISDIGINFSPISDIRHPILCSSEQWVIGKALACEIMVLSSNPADVINIFWISDIGMDSDVDIGILPISE